MSTQPPIELFSCTKLSARLSVRACGARFLKVRAATKGSADYTSACDQCPVGAHHARTGALCPDVTTQTTAATAPTTTTKETTMAAKSEYSDGQKREAAKRILIDKEVPESVGKELGVSGTTIRNWVKRFGTEVASDAMDAAAGKGAEKTAPSKAAKAKRAAALAPSVPTAAIADEPRAALSPEVARIAQDLTEECKRLAPELAGAVRHIADRRVRAAVADAAWLLEEFARG